MRAATGLDPTLDNITVKPLRHVVLTAVIVAGGAQHKVLDVDFQIGYDCGMAQEYSLLRIDLSDDELAAARADAAATSLPLDGVILTRIVATGLENGHLEDEVLMSAQQHLALMADKIERDGISDDDVVDVIAKLRILSQFATTCLVPVDPY